jgi:hypothetical protein
MFGAKGLARVSSKEKSARKSGLTKSQPKTVI